MKASMLRFGAVTLAALTGCVRGPGQGLSRAPGRDQPPTSATSNPSRREGYLRKKVAGKEPPLRLIAKDGTSCSVSEKKYNATSLGDNVWCVWVDQGR